MFFGEGRKALLEFLRNLTPQILFMSLAFILGAKLDLSHFEFSLKGLQQAAPFVMCVLVVLGAMMANVTLFIDSAINSNESLDSEAERIKAMKLKALPRTLQLILAAWKFKKLAFLEVVLALVIAEAAILAVFLLAIQGALTSPFLR